MTLVPPDLCVLEGDRGESVDFFADVLPIIGDRCVRCHGGVRELGSPPLNLQSRDTAAFVLGQAGAPCSSELFRRVATTDVGRMPLGGEALSPDKVDVVRRWIGQGAPWPRHWAFAPLNPVEPGSISARDPSWAKTPIDRFILNRLDKAGIAPAPEADRTTLLRRVTLDLIGIPPTPQETDDFRADTSANAYEKVVDRLLQSPRFGETWARHWLDQAHYADSDGYERDAPRPNAWRWRDWVIEAFNRDQPFDQFTIEQIAGDLLPASTPNQRLATGFLRQTLINLEDGTDPEEDRTKRVIDRVTTVGATWLGLTFGCTQCHSHPYDPISQREFYRLYAFFNNTDEATVTVPGIGMSEGGDADVMAQDATRDTYLFIRGDFTNPDKSAALDPGTPAVLHPFAPRGAKPDRLDLARWIVSPTNPLTPRVTVNIIWAKLFGQGIVTTLDDFGSRAKLPSHPELLDWLARDFVEHGWQRKRVIKQMAMSATYRQSAAARADAAAIDPENTLLHRQNRLRLPAEAIADTSQAASGLLSTRIGGPSVYPPIAPELLNITVFGLVWPTSSGEDLHRRGMYTFFKRTLPYPSLQVFDAPSAYQSAPGRSRSNTPLQALTTMDNVVFVDAARALARRVQTEAPGDRRKQQTLAFRLALAREPTDAEIAELESLHQDSVRAYDLDPQGAADIVGADPPPGVSMSTAAGWVITARVILNLDETITRE